MNNEELLELKLLRTHSYNEGELHLDMKLWIAKEFLKQGVSVTNIYFEYMFKGQYRGKFCFTKSDVFIDDDKKTAIYCQCGISNDWIYNFIEKKIPILQKYSVDKAIIVLPCDLVMPSIYDDYLLEFLKYSEIVRTPYKLGTKIKVSVELDVEDVVKLGGVDDINELVISLVKNYVQATKEDKLGMKEFVEGWG